MSCGKLDIQWVNWTRPADGTAERLSQTLASGRVINSLDTRREGLRREPQWEEGWEGVKVGVGDLRACHINGKKPCT